MEYFLSVLGLVLIFEGLPYFAFPDKMKRILENLPLIPDSTLRKYGFAAIIFGLLLIYLGRSA